MEEFSSFRSRLRQPKGDFKPRIAFADSNDPRVLQAILELGRLQKLTPVLLGEKDEIGNCCQKLSLPLDWEGMVYSDWKSSDQDKFVNIWKTKAKNLSTSSPIAPQLSRDSLFGALYLLSEGRVDGVVAGATRTTSDVVKGALSMVGPHPGVKFVSGQFLIESLELKTMDKGPFLMADCAVVQEPSPRSLAVIAENAAQSFEFFTGCKARVAFLSFSTRGSAEHPTVDRIREALTYLKDKNPQILADGELQADAALSLNVAETKGVTGSPVAGQANVLIFPTLEVGNITYKLIQRFSKVRIAGPLLWGLNKAMSDLSRGCEVQEIVDTALCVSEMVRRGN